jgi:predicted RNase H-like HicB family nuclease
MRQRYVIIIERAPANYSAYVPDVPGCIATGATIEETRARLADALADHVALLSELGQPVPTPETSLNAVVPLSPDDYVTTIEVELPAVLAPTI